MSGERKTAPSTTIPSISSKVSIECRELQLELKHGNHCLYLSGAYAASFYCELPGSLFKKKRFLKQEN